MCQACYVFKWQKEHPESRKETNRKQSKYRQAWLKEFYRKHPEKKIPQRQRYKAKHPDVIKAGQKAWRLANRAYHIAQSLLWRKENPDKARETMRRASQLRRATLKGSERTFTHDDWKEILKRFGGVCAYCQRKGNMTQDHIVPASKGGGYTADNIIPACKSCNSTRSNMSIAEFVEYMTRIRKPLNLHPITKSLLGR